MILKDSFLPKIYTDKPGKASRLYKPTSKLAELASTFKSSKDDKKEDRRDRDRDRNRDAEKRLFKTSKFARIKSEVVIIMPISTIIVPNDFAALCHLGQTRQKEGNGEEKDKSRDV